MNAAAVAERRETRIVSACVLMTLGLLLFGQGWHMARKKPAMAAAAGPVAAMAAPDVTHLEEANRLMRGGDYKAARAEFDAALNSGEDRIASLAGRAECSYMLKEDRPALNDCGLLLAEPAGRARACLLRGLIFKRQNRIEAARHEFQVGARIGDGISASHLKLLNSGN